MDDLVPKRELQKCTDWENGLSEKASINDVDEIIKDDSYHVRCLSEKQGFFVFQKGVKPVWSLPEHAQGGRWETFYSEGKSFDEVNANYWKLVQALIKGGDFGVNSERILGIVVLHPLQTNRKFKREIQLWMASKKRELEPAILEVGQQMGTLLGEETISFNWHTDFNANGYCSRSGVSPRATATPSSPTAPPPQQSSSSLEMKVADAVIEKNSSSPPNE